MERYDRGGIIVQKVVMGNWILVICTLFYLLWWTLTFRTDPPMASSFGGVCLGGAILTGLLGIAHILFGINKSTEDTTAYRPGVSGVYILAIGVIVYSVEMLITTLCFAREVTLELLVFTAWATLFMAEINYYHRFLGMSKMSISLLIALVGIIFLCCFACYVIYDYVDYPQSYYIGCLPLNMVIIDMIITNVTVLLSMRKREANGNH